MYVTSTDFAREECSLKGRQVSYWLKHTNLAVPMIIPNSVFEWYQQKTTKLNSEN